MRNFVLLTQREVERHQVAEMSTWEAPCHAALPPAQRPPCPAGVAAAAPTPHQTAPHQLKLYYVHLHTHPCTRASQKLSIFACSSHNQYNASSKTSVIWQEALQSECGGVMPCSVRAAFRSASEGLWCCLAARYLAGLPILLVSALIPLLRLCSARAFPGRDHGLCLFPSDPTYHAHRSACSGCISTLLLS